MGRQIPANGRETPAQFFSIAPVPSVPETAEPTFNRVPVTPLYVSRPPLRVCVPGSQARRRHPTGDRAEGAHRSEARRALGLLHACHRWQKRPTCCSFEIVRLGRSSRKSVRRASTGSSVSAAKKRESGELVTVPLRRTLGTANG